MKLTKRKALEICRELWLWLADNPEKSKDDWPGWKEYWPMISGCPCCEYIRHRYPFGILNCHRCLLKWPISRWAHSCLDDDTPYSAWLEPKSVDDRVGSALEIVALCDEALLEMGE